MSPPLSEAACRPPGTPPSTDSELQPKREISRVDFLNSAGQGQREQRAACFQVFRRACQKQLPPTSTHMKHPHPSALMGTPHHQICSNVGKGEIGYLSWVKLLPELHRSLASFSENVLNSRVQSSISLEIVYLFLPVFQRATLCGLLLFFELSMPFLLL